MPTAGATTFGTNSAVTVKLFSVMLQAEVEKRSIFVRMMTGRKSSQSMAVAKRQRQQTMPEMPIVLVDDLQQSAGDKVTVDMFNIVTGLPTMGDDQIEGRGAPINFSTMEVTIDQMRFPINAGSRMSAKRIKHNLRSIARANMASWFARTNDQIIQVHLAGARGIQNDQDWNVPLDSHELFNRIMVNPVDPPTSNRYFVAGGGTSVADLGTSDALKLEDIDEISTHLRNMPFPPAPIKVSTDMDGDSEPIWCLLVTENQWHYIVTRAGSNNQTWRRFIADAQTRRARTQNHPLFTGETGLWNSMLIKRMPRSIRFAAGNTVRTIDSSTGATVSSTVPGGITVERAILLGGQALACARGDAGGSRSGYPMRWTEVLRDHYNSVEIGAGQMDGKKKFRFTGSDGMITDFGVAVIDSYSPDPRSTEGQALKTALKQ